jgi:hypothetical protein
MTFYLLGGMMDVLDLFSERLELIKEHESWIEYVCPLCKNSGLKINRNTGYYKNYKCNCDTKKISAYIFINSTEYRKQRKPREVPAVIPEIPNVLGVKLPLIRKNDLSVTSTNLCDLNTKYEDTNRAISYFYSPTQRTLRINRIKSTGKKIIFPQVVVNDNWVNGVGDSIFPIFTNELTLKGNLVVVVEGEKCVEYLQSQGIETMSILNTYTTSIEKIKLVLSDRSKIPNITQFLYIPDLDVVGIKKAVIFQQATWSLGIPTKIFDIRKKLLGSTDFKRGYDIADYIIEDNNFNLVRMFEDEFSTR